MRTALEAGETAGRLRSGDLVTPFHGLRAHPLSHSTMDRARAFLPKLEPGAVYSHTTAAAIYGFPMPTWCAAEPLHVNTPALTRRHRTEGVVGHRWLSLHARVVRGLPVPEPEEVWISLACVLRERDLVRIGDHLLRRKWPLSTPERMGRTLERAQRRRGIRQLRAAATRVRARTESPKETDTRLTIVDAGLPEPVVAFEVHFDAGGYLATVDLAYPGLKIVIEYEGMHHQEDRDQYLTDIDRRRLLEQEGWIVVVVTKEHGRARIIRDVTEAIRRRS